MQIIGFNFKKVSAERKVTKMENVNVKHKVNLKDITKDEVNIGRKQDILKVRFEFSVDYAPDLGNIKLDGNILITDKEKEIAKILENWKKDKKLTTEQTTTLINSILIKSNIKALMLSQDVNLPPHIQLPKVTPQVKTDNYIG